MKYIKILLCIICAILTLTGCRGVPSGLFQSKKFSFNDNAREDILSSLENVSTDNFHIERSLEAFVDEEIFVSGASVVWYRTEAEIYQIYKEGKLYSLDHYTDKILKTEECDFDTTEYKKIAEDSLSNLKKIFTCDVDCFKVESSYSTIFEGLDVINVCLDFYGNAEDLKNGADEFGDTDYSVLIEFNYNKKTNKYSDFVIHDSNFIIYFDVAECPESLADKVDSFLNSEE